MHDLEVLYAGPTVSFTVSYLKMKIVKINSSVNSKCCKVTINYHELIRATLSTYGVCVLLKAHNPDLIIV